MTGPSSDPPRGRDGSARSAARARLRLAVHVARVEGGLSFAGPAGGGMVVQGPVEGLWRLWCAVRSPLRSGVDTGELLAATPTAVRSVLGALLDRLRQHDLLVGVAEPAVPAHPAVADLIDTLAADPAAAHALLAATRVTLTGAQEATRRVRTTLTGCGLAPVQTTDGGDPACSVHLDRPGQTRATVSLRWGAEGALVREHHEAVLWPARAEHATTTLLGSGDPNPLLAGVACAVLSHRVLLAAAGLADEPVAVAVRGEDLAVTEHPMVPLGAVAFATHLWSAFDDAAAVLLHGETQAGNPLSCAAALATLAVIRDEGLLERAGSVGAVLRADLQELVDEGVLGGSPDAG